MPPTVECANKLLNICMVSDFMYPNVGGVEEHIFQLSQCLLQLGHKVIVVTHVYGDRQGVRYMTNGLKVYYLPIQPFYNQSVLPTFLTSVPLLRDVLLRESVQIVHGHSAFSTMAHEAMSLASALGLTTVFTDHSLFGFADVSAIVTNNFLTVSLASVDHCICVSYVGKENTVLRASVPPERVSVIPNALDTGVFRPRPYSGPPGRIVVVVLSRLQYRKGVDLQPPIIRYICSKYPQVDFLIGGGGPKQGLLSEVRDELSPGRVSLLGALPHAAVPGVLARGHIFLNTSLTEAFCIAICEAVCSGLQVVSTDVGGISEVLPPHLILLARPTVRSLCSALEVAIDREVSGRRLPPAAMHAAMRTAYTWRDVARRTDTVYKAAVEGGRSATFADRMQRYRACGAVAGLFMVLLVALQGMLLLLCQYMRPAQEIDHASDFTSLFNISEPEDGASNPIVKERHKSEDSNADGNKHDGRKYAGDGIFLSQGDALPADQPDVGTGVPTDVGTGVRTDVGTGVRTDVGTGVVTDGDSRTFHGLLTLTEVDLCKQASGSSTVLGDGKPQEKHGLTQTRRTQFTADTNMPKVYNLRERQSNVHVRSPT